MELELKFRTGTETGTETSSHEWTTNRNRIKITELK